MNSNIGTQLNVIIYDKELIYKTTDGTPYYRSIDLKTIYLKKVLGRFTIPEISVIHFIIHLFT